MKTALPFILSLYLGVGMLLLHLAYLWYATHFHLHLRCSVPGAPTLYWQPFKKAVLFTLPVSALALLLSWPISASVLTWPDNIPVPTPRLAVFTAWLAGLYLLCFSVSQLTTGASITKAFLTGLLFAGFLIAHFPAFTGLKAKCTSGWLFVFGAFSTYAIPWTFQLKSTYKQHKGEGMFPQVTFLCFSLAYILLIGAYVNLVTYYHVPLEQETTNNAIHSDGNSATLHSRR